MLYIVATPIGNLKDITQRAIDTLSSVESIVVEDTRKTGILLSYYSIKKPMIVFNDFNEGTKLVDIITRLEKGENIALVSDSGTPLISDPGYKLVKEAMKRNIAVTTIPGASAVISALVISGLPTDKFLFLGFLPKSDGKRKNYLQALAATLQFADKNSISPTIIFYEAPHRLESSLQTVLEVFGDIEIVVAKEITKIHETVLKNIVSGVIQELKKTSVRGEYVLLFHLP